MRILVATDGSPAAGTAIGLVAATRWPDGTTIRVLETIETRLAVFGGPGPAVAMVEQPEVEAEFRRLAQQTVSEAQARLERAGVEVTLAIVTGRAATEIVEAARTMPADLIVVGSRGHGAIESMLLGSVSAEVVDHAPCPVLVARGDGLQRVVFAWDGSAGAEHASSLLRDWPMFTGTSVHVVTVDDIHVPWWTGFPTPGSAELMPLFVEAAAASRVQHDEMANAMTAELRGAGLDAQPDLREGDPAVEILAAAREMDAELIVMGTRGRTGIRRLVLGSVARNVLHHADRSVLVVRETVHPTPDTSDAGGGSTAAGEAAAVG